MIWTADAVMQALYTLVAVMLVVILYHALFIIVDLRKTMRRIRNLTEQVEGVIMKPLNLTEQVLGWLVEYVEGLAKSKHSEHHKTHHHEAHAGEKKDE
jgi:cell shape-determining protein MreC